MTIWMWGSMKLAKPVPDELRIEIVKKYDGMFSFSADGEDLDLDYTMGDYGDDISEIARFLEKRGYAVDPEKSSFPYTGDYDGGYLYEDGNFESFDQEEFILRTLPAETLIGELNRRNLRSNSHQN